MMLTTKHRNALLLLKRAELVNRGEFSSNHIGEKTLRDLVEHGLAVKSQTTSGIEQYRLTENGDAALQTPKLKPAKKRSDLKTLKPQLNELPDPWKRQ